MITIKPVYHDYVQYMWRQYVRHGGTRPDQTDSIALANWAACDAVSSTVTDSELETIARFVDDTYDRNYSPDWKTIRKVFRLTAERRGLCRKQKEGQ